MYRKVMATGSPSKTSAAAELAQKLHEALLRERIVPRFVDSYVVENSREALQVHAVMYRDLLTLLQREALLALSARALEIVYNEPRAQGRSKPRPMRRREAALFRKKFLTALVRQLGWTAGDALDCANAPHPQTVRSREPSVCRPLRVSARFLVSRKSAPGRQQSADKSRRISHADCPSGQQRPARHQDATDEELTLTGAIRTA